MREKIEYYDVKEGNLYWDVMMKRIRRFIIGLCIAIAIGIILLLIK